MSTTRTLLPSLWSGGDDSLYRVAGKYVSASLVGSIAWIAILYTLSPASTSPPSEVGSPDLQSILGLCFFGSIVLSVLPAVYFHRQVPSEVVDRYHSLGIQFSMLLSVNVIITLSSLAIWSISYHAEIPTMLGDGWSVWNGVGLVVVSSIFLPGPYFGTLVGRKWAK